MFFVDFRSGDIVVDESVAKHLFFNDYRELFTSIAGSPEVEAAMQEWSEQLLTSESNETAFNALAETICAVFDPKFKHALEGVAALKEEEQRGAVKRKQTSIRSFFSVKSVVEKDLSETSGDVFDDKSTT